MNTHVMGALSMAKDDPPSKPKVENRGIHLHGGNHF
jgi:hypothetical protein